MKTIIKALLFVYSISYLLTAYGSSFNVVNETDYRFRITLTPSQTENNSFRNYPKLELDIVSKVDGVDASWALGAAIYYEEGNK